MSKRTLHDRQTADANKPASVRLTSEGTFNATKSTERADSRRIARHAGAANLSKRQISAEIARRLQKRVEKAKDPHAALVRELDDIVNADVASLFHGRILKPVDEWPPIFRRYPLASAVYSNNRRTYKLELADRTDFKELLGRLIGAFDYSSREAQR